MTLALLPVLAVAQTVTLSTPVLQSNGTGATDVEVTLNAAVSSQSAASVTGTDTLQEFAISPADQVATGLPSQLNLFCTELGQDAPGYGISSPQTYTILPITSGDMGRASNSIDAIDGVPVTGIGNGMATKLEKLYGYVFPSYTSSSPLSINLGIALVGGSGASYSSAVFQLAAWQIAETNTYANITNPGPAVSGFYVSSDKINGVVDSGGLLVQDADTLLRAVANATNVTSLNLDSLHSDSAQDFILPDPTGSYLSIPEPGMYAAVIGVAALGLAAIRRERKPA